MGKAWRAAAVVVVTAALGIAFVVVRARDVAVRPPEFAASEACRRAMEFAPTSVSGHERRDTEPVSPGTAAWGDPAIVARCGVGSPGPTEDECLDVDGVFWVVQALSDGTRFTTFGREPAVEVLVPRDYAPESLLLPAFGQVGSTLPENGRTCQ